MKPMQSKISPGNHHSHWETFIDRKYDNQLAVKEKFHSDVVAKSKKSLTWQRRSFKIFLKFQNFCIHQRSIRTEKLSLTASSLNFKQGRKFSQRGVSKARSESQALYGRMKFKKFQNYAMNRIQQRFWWRTASKHLFHSYEDDMRQVV